LKIERCCSADDFVGGALAFFWRQARLRGLARLWVVPLFASLLITGACRAQPSAARERPGGDFAPSEVRRLRDFGAAGDARTDDTAALQRALSNSGHYCLDGEGRSYRVTGTLRAEEDLCLRNATLIQALVPFDTRPYIRHSCPVTLNPAAVVDCGDPAIPPEQLSRLRESLSVRTLLIRRDHGATLRVTLDHVKVDRGPSPEGGSRTDSAGIWLEGADGVDLRNVEVTGFGKGYGLIVLRSSDVSVDNLWVHDLVWSPYAGDTPLSRERVSAIGWNSVPIHEFREAGQDGLTVPKFYGVRVQEQITCVLFSEVRNVFIRNPKVSGCSARFEDGDLPWQADGLDISRASSNVDVEGAIIDSTWEGMDVVGAGGVDGLAIHNARVSNSFGFGLKLGYQLRNARISDSIVTNSGIAGIVLYGPVDGATVSNVEINGVGILSLRGRSLEPWSVETHSGIAIEEGPTGEGAARAVPRNVLLENVTVANAPGAPGYEFGILNKGGTHVQIRGLRATGFSKAESIGVPAVHQQVVPRT
jgi:hypothetical protein